MEGTTVNPMYTLQDVPGKGKGLIATRKIAKGTRILSEKPLFTVPETEANWEQAQKSIYQKVSALSEQEQLSFLSLHNIHPFKTKAEQYLGIVRTNTLPADGDNGGIFLEACRINHACNNNAQKYWNDNIKRHTIHAMREIEEGEEITVYYLGTHRSRESRRQALEKKFHFACSCGLCSLPPKESQASDRRLDEIEHIDYLVGQFSPEEGIKKHPLKTLSYYDRQVILCNEEGRYDVGLAHAFVSAAQLTIANGDVARGRVFSERAASVWTTVLGGDSKEAEKWEVLARNPSMLPLYGFSMQWKTRLDEIPRELEPSAFEDWLWRKEEKQQQAGAGLRDRTFFPSFECLAREGDVMFGYGH